MNNLRRKLLGWMAASPAALIGMSAATHARPVLTSKYSGKCEVYRFGKTEMLDRLGKVEFDPSKQTVGKALRTRWAGPKPDEIEDDSVVFYCDPLVLIYCDTWVDRGINGFYHPDQRQRRMYVRWYDIENDVVRMDLVSKWGPADVLAPEKYKAITAAVRQHVYGAA